MVLYQIGGVNNVDVEKIYKTRLKFKYEPPISTWKDEIAPGNKKYVYDGRVAIDITKRFFDMENNRFIEPSSITTDSLICTKERAEYLIGKGVANEQIRFG